MNKSDLSAFTYVNTDVLPPVSYIKKWSLSLVGYINSPVIWQLEQNLMVDTTTNKLTRLLTKHSNLLGTNRLIIAPDSPY